MEMENPLWGPLTGEAGSCPTDLEAAVVLADSVGKEDAFPPVHEGPEGGVLITVDVVAHKATVDAVTTSLLLPIQDVSSCSGRNKFVTN